MLFVSQAVIFNGIFVLTLGKICIGASSDRIATKKRLKLILIKSLDTNNQNNAQKIQT